MLITLLPLRYYVSDCHQRNAEKMSDETKVGILLHVTARDAGIRPLKLTSISNAVELIFVTWRELAKNL